MGGFSDKWKPALALICLQLMNAGIAIFTRTAFLHGLNPMVFVVYRHALSTFIMAPLSFLSTRKCSDRSPLRLNSFAWIFLASIGLTANQNFYFQGLYMASSTVASAMNNLIPAITFAMATIFGMEKVQVGSLRSMAKIIGTVFCISGAISMAFLKGPTLSNNTEFALSKSYFRLEGENYWLLGCLLLFASSCFYSFWMILQVPISASCPDHLCSSAWMSFLVTIESAAITLSVTKDISAWNLSSHFEMGSCLYAGIVQALAFFIQAWCISRTGPLFTAIFNPLSTVIVSIVAAILHEEAFLGCLIGALAMIIGLYIVLWGKAKDLEEIENLELQGDNLSIALESLEKNHYTADFEVPLISHNFANVH